MSWSPWRDANGNPNCDAILERWAHIAFTYWNRHDYLMDLATYVGGQIRASIANEPTTAIGFSVIRDGNNWSISCGGTNDAPGVIQAAIGSLVANTRPELRLAANQEWSAWYQRIRDYVCAEMVSPERLAATGGTITFCGYSGGAAVAFLLACYYSLTVPVDNIAVFNFAEPRSIANVGREPPFTVRHFRFCNRLPGGIKDPICDMPSPLTFLLAPAFVTVAGLFVGNLPPVWRHHGRRYDIYHADGSMFYIPPADEPVDANLDWVDHGFAAHLAPSYNETVLELHKRCAGAHPAVQLRNNLTNLTGERVPVPVPPPPPAFVSPADRPAGTFGRIPEPEPPPLQQFDPRILQLQNPIPATNQNPPNQQPAPQVVPQLPGHRIFVKIDP